MHRPPVYLGAVFAMLISLMPIRGQAEDTIMMTEVGATERDSLEITVYTGGFALINDYRQLPLKQGTTEIVLVDVPSSLIAESVQLAPIRSGAFKTQQMSLQAALLTPGALLRRYVGREVGLIKTHPTTGAETEVKAQVLSANGPVLLVDGRLETGVPGRLVFPEAPASLHARAALVARVEARASAPVPATFRYLADGLSWQADYTATLNEAGTGLDLTGWATIRNATDAPFDQATLRVVAGDVSRGPRRSARRLAQAPKALRSTAAAGTIEEAAPRQSLGANHLYTLPGTIDLAAGEQKQIALLRAKDVSLTETLISRGSPNVFQAAAGPGRPSHPAVEITFDNAELAGAGLPLPRGTVRVYRRALGAGLKFVGADSLPDTPSGERARLRLGTAFDVTVRRKQTAFKRLDPRGRNVEAAFAVTLKNARNQATPVRVEEQLPGDWQIVETSDTGFERDGPKAVWTVDVPAGGEKRLTYRVKVLR